MGTFKSRYKKLLEYDLGYNVQKISGFDEVGRGSLAGPIVSGCVIYDLNKVKDLEEELYYIRDSKTLNKKKISELSLIIREVALHYDIFFYDNNIIDDWGIQKCNQELINESIKFSVDKSTVLLIDGIIKPSIENESIKYYNMPKGDNLSLAIASASIIAKDYRDKIMQNIEPDLYDFQNNVGYGSPTHIKALKEYGYSNLHRKSFLKNILGEI